MDAAVRRAAQGDSAGGDARIVALAWIAGGGRYLTVEFPKKTKALPDLVVRLADRSILHVELQAKNDARIEWRCLKYRMAMRELWRDERIQQKVVYLGAIR